MKLAAQYLVGMRQAAAMATYDSDDDGAVQILYIHLSFLGRHGGRHCCNAGWLHALVARPQYSREDANPSMKMAIQEGNPLNEAVMRT